MLLPRPQRLWGWVIPALFLAACDSTELIKPRDRVRGSTPFPIRLSAEPPKITEPRAGVPFPIDARSTPLSRTGSEHLLRPPLLSTGLKNAMLDPDVLPFNASANFVVPTPSLVWYANTGSATFWKMNGATWGGDGATVLQIPSPWRMVAAADLNADLHPDLIWESTTDGARAVVFMNGPAYGGSYAMMMIIPPEWRIVAGADMSADGKPDIIIENTSTGDHYVLFMDGATYSGSLAPLLLTPLEWQLATVADMNGDSKPDLVWQNTSDGTRVVTFMDGGTYTGESAIIAAIPVDWKIAASADFNADSKNDLLIQNATDGQRRILLMNGSVWSGQFSQLPSVGIEHAIVAATQIRWPGEFNFSREMSGAPVTLSLSVLSLNPTSGQVTIGGGDSRAPTTPFTFAWGDGTTSSGFFNHGHTYSDRSRNYTARVTAHYADGTTDAADIAIRFVPSQLTHIPLPAAVAVTIPQAVPALTSRQAGYLTPPGLMPFDDSFFSATTTRANAEYVLSLAAAIEFAVLENDVEIVDGGARQVVLRDPAAGGAYSIWFSTPIAFAAGNSFFQPSPGYSSLFHEMGHNLSLNAPADFRYGGKIDGNANAIFSEAVAQMFQHAVAYELINNASAYGLPVEMALDISNSARASAQLVRSSYDTFVAQAKPFTTWNDPLTGGDETLGTFMTVARQFMIHAEESRDYIGSLTRTMRLLRTFDQNLANQYEPSANTLAASRFRSTLMIAALSYGFQRDLRPEFTALNFLVDDTIFTNLMNSVP